MLSCLNLTNGIRNKYYDWFKCCLNNPEHFVSYVKTTLRFACQINISLKIINKVKFLGVPRNFLHWMGDLLTRKKD